MKTDRELMELAAKAAGISGTWYDFPGMATRHGYAGAIYDEDKDAYWNPLTNNGDALWLAATLEMDLNLGQGGAVIYMSRGTPNIEELSDDYMAATRLAIVRAAAHLGEVRSRND